MRAATEDIENEFVKRLKEGHMYWGKGVEEMSRVELRDEVRVLRLRVDQLERRSAEDRHKAHEMARHYRLELAKAQMEPYDAAATCPACDGAFASDGDLFEPGTDEVPATVSRTCLNCGLVLAFRPLVETPLLIAKTADQEP